MGFFSDPTRALTAFATGGISEGIRALEPEKLSAIGPSAQEQEILDLQLQQLRAAGLSIEEIQPFLLENLGLRRTEEGTLERIQRPEDELEQLLTERALTAARGELPVSPGLEADIARQRASTEEALRRKFGPTFQASTGGLELESRFSRQANLLREESRRGALGQATQLAGGRLGLLSDIGARQFGQLQGFQAPRLGLLGAAGGALQPLQFQRGLEQDISLQNVLNQAQFGSDVFGLIGTAGGAALGAG